MNHKELLEAIDYDLKRSGVKLSILSYFIDRNGWNLAKYIKLFRYTSYYKSNSNKSILYKFLYKIDVLRLRILNAKYKIYLDVTDIEPGFVIHHFDLGCISIAPDAHIGKNFTIRQKCVIGYNGTDFSKAPIIEDNVDFSVGASAFGGITIGRWAQLGANCVVTKNIPPYAIVAGNPAKIVGFKMTPEEIVKFEEENYPEEERIPIKKLQRNYDKYFENREKIAEFISLY